MAYDMGAIDANLAAAAGEDAALLNELRGAFAQSASRQADLLRRSRCDGNWTVAAMRLKGLAASFHAEELMMLAQDAIEGAPGDPAVLRHIESAIAKFA